MTKEHRRVFEWLNTAEPLPDKFKLPSKQKLLLWINLMIEELGEFKEAVEEDNEVEARKEYADILYVYYNIACRMGYKNPERDFHLVSNSNDTKFCNTEEEANNSLRKYDEKGVATKYHKKGDKYIITDDEGKIKKGINYKPCELSDLDKNYVFIPTFKEGDGIDYFLSPTYTIVDNPYLAMHFQNLEQAKLFINGEIEVGRLLPGWAVEEHYLSKL